MTNFKTSPFGVIGLVTLVAALSSGGSNSRAQNRSKSAPARATHPPTASRSEVKYYTITLTQARAVEAYVPDAANFLADPVGTLRRNGFAVPPAAERHWRSFTVALRRLSNPKLPPSQNTPIIFQAIVNNEVIKNEIVRLQLPRGWIPVVGDLHFDGTASVSNDSWIIINDGTPLVRALGVDLLVAEEPAWQQLADALKALRRAYAGPETQPEPARDRFYRTKPHVNVSAAGEGASGQAVETQRKDLEAKDKLGNFEGPAVSGRTTGVAADPGDTNAAQADLMIKQFLFPPTNDKALRVHVVNQGNAASAACRLILTIRKINGTPVGRQTHVNIPALAAGANVWLVIDAKNILPNNVSLESTTFRLNADSTGIVAELDETNNEVWHNQ